jgi:hypothetical protein
MACAFVENCVWIVYNNGRTSLAKYFSFTRQRCFILEVEEGYLHHEKEALKYAVKNLDTAIKKVFIFLNLNGSISFTRRTFMFQQNLSDIVIEIFRILNNVPPKRVLRLLSSVLWEFRNGYSEDLKKALLGTLVSVIQITFV